MYPTAHAATTSLGQVCVMAPMFKLCFPALLFTVVNMAQAEDKTLNLYSWADYVPPQTLQRFEKETGIHVRYDTFDTSEVLETKLLTGGSGYDVVVPSSSVLARGLAAGALKEIPHEGLKGYANLDPDLLTKLAAVDPGNRYAVPYTWGTLGLGMNVEAVKKRLPDVPLNSLDLLFKPEYAAKLKTAASRFLIHRRKSSASRCTTSAKIRTAPTKLIWPPPKRCCKNCNRPCSTSPRVGRSAIWPTARSASR